MAYAQELCGEVPDVMCKWLQEEQLVVVMGGRTACRQGDSIYPRQPKHIVDCPPRTSDNLGVGRCLSDLGLLPSRRHAAWSVLFLPFTCGCLEIWPAP